MHDSNSLTSEGMYYRELAESVHHFKTTEKGRGIMCEAVKEYAKEYAEEHAKEYAKEYAKDYAEEYAKEYSKARDMEQVKNVMNKLKYSAEEAFDLLNISGEEKRAILQQLQNQN